MTTSSSPSKSTTSMSSPLRGEIGTSGTTANPAKIRSSPSSPHKKAPSPAKPQAVIAVSRPSAEDLVDLERELHRFIARKNQADANLITLESRLYDLETEYLTETATFGNLIDGLEGYLGLPPTKSTIAASTTTATTASSSAAPVINSQQRLFSNTSTTFPVSLALAGRTADALANGYQPASLNSASSAITSKNFVKNFTKPSASSSTASRKSGNGNNSSSNNKSTKKNVKKTDSTASEWLPPSMKSSRKK